MSLQNKFRLLLAVFGVSVLANVLISVWCISVYFDHALSEFNAHLDGQREVSYARIQIGTLLRELQHRPELLPDERDDQYKAACDEIERRIQAIAETQSGKSGLPISDKLIKLGKQLRATSERYTNLVDTSRLDEAADYLRTQVEEKCVVPLHRLLATVGISHDQASAETLMRILQTKSSVTVLLAANAIVAFLLSATGVLLVRNWVLKPVELLKRAAEEHADGNLQYRIERHANDELGTLARAVNRMADSLIEIQKRLVQQERLAALGEVASTVAHNIRNPLAGIRASAQSSLGEVEAGGAAEKRQMRIVETVDSLNQWVKQLLLVNQPIELHCKPTPMRELVDAVLRVQRSNAERCRVTFAYHQPNDGCSAHVDPRHIEQAIHIVVDNAIDASPPGGQITITAECAPGTDRWIDLRVADEGPGIPENIRDQVAAPYFTTKPGGTGIGLHLAKKTVESHGGEITIECQPPGGTTVTLRLPARKLFGARDGQDTAGG